MECLKVSVGHKRKFKSGEKQEGLDIMQDFISYSNCSGGSGGVEGECTVSLGMFQEGDKGKDLVIPSPLSRSGLCKIAIKCSRSGMPNRRAKPDLPR